MTKLFLFLIIVLSLSSCNQKPQWEYGIRSIDDASFKQSMDTLGSEGWELVSARRASDGSSYSPKFSYEIIFKRQK